MPIKKRIQKVRENRITPEAVAAFLAGDQTALHRALSLAPWQPSPLEVGGPYHPEWVGEADAWAAAWPAVWQLRRELEKAAK